MKMKITVCDICGDNESCADRYVTIDKQSKRAVGGQPDYWKFISEFYLISRHNQRKAELCKKCLYRVIKSMVETLENEGMTL